MRKTALPLFISVVFISMRDAGFNVGQRCLLRCVLLVISRVVFLMRFRVSVPVVVLLLRALGSVLRVIGFSLRLR